MLNRAIKRWDLVLLMINSIIGAGIFGLPSRIFALTGIYSLLAFAACAIAVMFFIACFAEVSSRFEQTGGPYVYTLEAFGKFPAFLMGWLLMLSRLFNFATLINLLVIYLSYFTSAFNDVYIRGGCILLIILLLTLVNYVGVKNTARLSNVLTIAKLIPLAIFILVGLFHLQPSLLTAKQPFEAAPFSSAVLLLVFAFGGFESTLVNTGEVKNPAKNLPFALITSAITVAIFYCLIQLVCIGTVPDLASSVQPVAEAASIFMGKPGGLIIAAGAVISIVGTLNVILLSASRLPFALSNEGQLFPVFGYVHPKYRTPTWSLLLMSVLTLVISLLWNFITALAIAAIIRVLMYAMVCACLVRLRKKQAGPEKHFKVKGGYFFAAAGILVAGWLLSASPAGEIRDVSICIAGGTLFYFFYSFYKTSAARAKRSKPGEGSG